MSPPITITGPWRKLVDHVGGVTALAQELGVTRNTIYTWINGTKSPRLPTRAHVDAFATKRGLQKPFGGR
jgi:DNA-binding phage protein